MIVASLQHSTADLFSLLGHPVRLRVLDLLADRDHEADELLKALHGVPGDVNEQIGILRRAQLIDVHRTGGAVVYSLRAPSLVNVFTAARRLLLEMNLAEPERLRPQLEIRLP